jgi:hypothetical protein
MVVVSFRLPDVVRNHPTTFVLYALFGLHSLMFQAFIRLEQCTGVVGCSVSLAKDAAWSIIWPVYWLGRFVFF